MTPPTTRTIEGGSWKGCVIRRARKAGPCQYGRLRSHEDARCEKRIQIGDEYFDGEVDEWKAGGFAMKRYCMDHIESSHA